MTCDTWSGRPGAGPAGEAGWRVAVFREVPLSVSGLFAELGDGFARAAPGEPADVVVVAATEGVPRSSERGALVLVVASPDAGGGEAVRALDAGADAFVATSSLGEVAAHVRALARRLRPGRGGAFP